MPSINTFNKVDWCTMNGLDLLLNGLHAAPYFNTDFTENFEKEFAPGETIRVPLTQRYIPQVNDLSYNPQALNRPYTTITVDQTRTIPFDFQTVESALDMERGEARVRKIYLTPAMAYLRQQVDSYCAQFAAQNANMVTGALGTNPSSFDATSAATRQALIEMGCPVQDVDVGLLMPPAVMRAIKTSGLLYLNPVADVSKAFRAGYYTTADGLDLYESMSLYNHTAGTWAGSVTVNGASQSGSLLNVTCTTGDTFKKGDKIEIADVNAVNLMSRQTFGKLKTFTITADVTGASSAASLPIYPNIYGPGSNYQNVDALPADGAALTLWPGTTSPSGKSGTLAIALYKDAFMLVGVKMMLPPNGGGIVSSQTQDPETGIAIAFVRQWDNLLRRWTNRFDMLFGAGVGLAEQCANVIACA